MNTAQSGTLVEDRNWRLKQWFPQLPEEVQAKLFMFHMELNRFNSAINLISRRTEGESDEVHFADSVYGCMSVLAATSARVIHDIGSGNGFPGVVLAILSPEHRVVMIDSDARKVEFLKHCIAKLGLNAVAQQKRLEDLDEGEIECAVSRGFASVSKTLILARKPCRVGAEYFHFKGSIWARELAEIPSQICSFWQPRLVSEYSLPASKAQMVIVATKRVG